MPRPPLKGIHPLRWCQSWVGKKPGTTPLSSSHFGPWGTSLPWVVGIWKASSFSWSGMVPEPWMHICILSACALQPTGISRGPWAQLLKGHPLTSPCLLLSPPPSHFAYHLHTSACWFGEPSTLLTFTMSPVKSQIMFITGDSTPS